MNLTKSIKNLTKTEKILWISSMLTVFISSLLSPEADLLSSVTSLIGAGALIFVGKGDPIGQLLSIIFSLFYALVSFRFRYWGEMITYLGMTFPAASWALFEWIRNPYTEREVKVAQMTPKKWGLLCLGTILITLIMWRVLAFFNTPNLAISTVSIATSFFACALVILRSPYYALFYGLNDIVLITLWVLASIEDRGYIPMVVCFIIFLANDTYGFINWRRMENYQG